MPLEIPSEITIKSLTDEVKASPIYSKMDDKAWDLLITQRGINHIDDKILAEFIVGIPDKLSKLYEQLSEAYDTNPTTAQYLSIQNTLFSLESKKIPLTQSLQTAKAEATAKDGLDPKNFTEESKALIQEAANKVAAVDGKIDEVSKPLQIPDQIKECERAIGSIKEKFYCAINEQRLRDSGTKREYAHTVYYMDFTPVTHSHITGDVTFTNGDATVTGAGAANFDADGDNIVAGDYIRQSNGTEWYKVSSVTNSTALELTINFQQATHTDDTGASFWCKSATNNGLAINDAFPHLNRYTTDTARTAGDILKVRANQTNVIAGVNITFDEAGTVIAYNEIRGCSVADDPFSDSSNVQPIFDFGNTDFQIDNQRDYYRLYNLDITNNNKNGGMVYMDGGKGGILDTLTVHLNNNASGKGVYTSDAAGAITNCTIYSNKNSNVYISNAAADILISSSIFDGGAAGTSYGINILAGIAFIQNSTFGITTTHSTASISVCAITTVRNCIYSDTTFITGLTASKYALSEDEGQVIGAHKGNYYNGTVTKCAAGLTTTTVRIGGSLSSALMLPASYCNIKYPLNIAYGALNPDFAIWCSASPTTVTVWMRAYTIWATYPTAAQLFIQADYWAGATAIRSQSTASTQTLVDTRDPAGAGTYTADAGTNTTTVVDAALAGTAYIGKYLYNTTRSAGAEITNYDNGTKTITLGTAITSQTSGDTFYVLDWVGFTTTFTPGTAGFAYIKCNLGLYASGKGIYVDVLPVVS
jgi:hypothetical protein